MSDYCKNENCRRPLVSDICAVCHPDRAEARLVALTETAEQSEFGAGMAAEEIAEGKRLLANCEQADDQDHAAFYEFVNWLWHNRHALLAAVDA